MDTITLKLSKEQVPNIDLLNDVAEYLNDVSVHHYANGSKVWGWVGNMKVTVSEYSVKITNSLTKYHLGDNIKEMKRSDIERAIIKLSDALHLPIDKAQVIRFDFARNIPLTQDVKLYLPYLGGLSRHQRYQHKTGINYKVTNREIAIYDKVAEMKKKKDIVPLIYAGKNVLRIEKRYLKNIAKYFNRAEIIASTLYDEAFYMDVMNDWHRDYCRIDKLQNSVIDMSNITTLKQLQSLGVLALVERLGGELAALNIIKERQSKGELNKKQAYDLRGAIKESAKLSITSKENELISELNSKVDESVRYYR